MPPLTVMSSALKSALGSLSLKVITAFSPSSRFTLSLLMATLGGVDAVPLSLSVHSAAAPAAPKPSKGPKASKGAAGKAAATPETSATPKAMFTASPFSGSICTNPPISGSSGMYS